MVGTLNTRIRKKSIKEKIESLWSPPIVVDNFLSPEEISFLKEKIATTQLNKSHKGNGDKALQVSFVDKGGIPAFFLEKIKNHIQGFSIKSAFAFDSNTPFMLHTDAGLNPETIPYKNITYCLEPNLFEEQLVLFNAYGYFSVSVNDLKNFVYSKETLENYNYLLATPEEFKNSPNARVLEGFKPKLSGEDKNILLSHIPKELHEHFAIVDVIKFEYNRAIIFDSCQLHSGSSYKKVEFSAQPKRLVLFTEFSQ